MSDVNGADWPQQNDLNQAGGGQPSPGQPLSLAPPGADPNAGAGWKQGVKQAAGAIGSLARGIHFGQDGSVGPQGAQQPGQQTQQDQQLLQRAQQLLKQGVISAAQYAQMTGGQLPPGIAGQMAPPGMAPTHSPSVNGQPPQPIQNGVSVPVYQPPAPPNGPTSPAWRG